MYSLAVGKLHGFFTTLRMTIDCHDACAFLTVFRSIRRSYNSP